MKAEGIPFSLDICGKCEIYEKENSTDPDMCPDYNLRLERDGKRMEPGRKTDSNIKKIMRMQGHRALTVRTFHWKTIYRKRRRPYNIVDQITDQKMRI